MAQDRCSRAGEIVEISARIVVAERTQSTLIGMLQELDQVDLPMTAIHVNSALEQIRLDLSLLKSGSD